MTRLRLDQGEKRLFVWLWVGCVFGLVAILPYAFELKGTRGDLDLTTALLAALNGFVLYPIPIYIGILVKRSIPLAGAPFLEGREQPNWRELVLRGVVPGILVALVVVVAEHAFDLVGADLKSLEPKTPSVGAGFLASFYGGVVEEVLMRFFFMGLMARLLSRFGKMGIWSAIIISALAFGIGHLPALTTALGLESVTQLSPVLVARVLALNAVVGLLSGWLYWRKGIEFAISAHFAADVVLHALIPVM